MYYVELTTAPNVIWADLKKLNLSKGAPVMAINPGAVDLEGDVSAKFREITAPL